MTGKTPKPGNGQNAETMTYKSPSKPTRPNRGTAVAQSETETSRSAVPAFSGHNSTVRNQTAAADAGNHGPDRRGGAYGAK